MHAGNSADSADPFVTVICPTCHARLNPRRELIGKRVRCPDCGVGVRVIDSGPAFVPPPPPTAGEYSVSGFEQPVEQRKTFLLKCPTCGTRLFPSVDLVGKRVRCPDCQKPVVVPPLPIEHAARPLRSPGEYGVGTSVTPMILPESTYLKHVAKIEKEEPPPPPPPKLWWWTGVFSFPWDYDHGARWAALTVFMTLASGITFFIGSLLLENNGIADLKIVISISAFALIWLFTMGFVSGCATAIVRSTAAGNDAVADWSDLELRDIIWNSSQIWFPLLSAAGVSAGGYLLAGQLAPQFWWLGAGVVFLLVFPVMLFSVMEHGSSFALITPGALKLIYGHLRGWILFLVECTALVALVAGLSALGLKYSLIVTALVGGPIYAALVMILARLMGRFFFRAHEVVETRREEKELAETEVDEDEIEEEEEGPEGVGEEYLA